MQLSKPSPALRPHRLSRHRSPAEGPRLESGSRIAVVGGGPAGSLFAYFLLGFAETLGRHLDVEILEARDFQSPAPAGCNMCGGIVSESLVQMLAAEGITLPSSVIQRGIDSYVLHMDVGTVRIVTPLDEMRVGAVHRGLGPRDLKQAKWGSFDAFLLAKAAARGARVTRARVTGLGWKDSLPQVRTAEGPTADYELLVVAGGVNSDAPQLMTDGLGVGYRAPGTATTFIREYFLGQEEVERLFGSSMHVFLLDIPRLEFAAIIPKGEYATVCMLGDGIDKKVADAFMQSPEVQACFPAGYELPARSCQCSPRINVRGVERPFSDRLLILGDCGVTRLYKDGIGAAYRTSKVAAAAAALHGISAASFERHFRPAVEAIRADNRLGRLVFSMTDVLKAHRFARRGVLRMTAAEQTHTGRRRQMSQVLWDIFTGSAPYRSVLARALRPSLVAGLLWWLSAATIAPHGGGRDAPQPQTSA